MGVHWKRRGEVMKNQFIDENCIKGGLGQFADLSGGLA